MDCSINGNSRDDDADVCCLYDDVVFLHAGLPNDKDIDQNNGQNMTSIGRNDPFPSACSVVEKSALSRSNNSSQEDDSFASCRSTTIHMPSATMISDDESCTSSHLLSVDDTNDDDLSYMQDDLSLMTEDSNLGIPVQPKKKDGKIISKLPTIASQSSLNHMCLQINDMDVPISSSDMDASSFDRDEMLTF